MPPVNIDKKTEKVQHIQRHWRNSRDEHAEADVAATTKVLEDALYRTDE